MLARTARWLWRDFESLPRAQQENLLGELLALLVSVPLLLVALIGLIARSRLSTLADNWLLVFLLLGLDLLLSHVSYFQRMAVGSNQVGYNISSLSPIATAAAVFLLGYEGLWLIMLGTLIRFTFDWPRGRPRAVQLDWFRNMLHNLWNGVLSWLAALFVYEQLGGAFPLADFSPAAVLPALVGVFVKVAASSGLVLLMILPLTYRQEALKGPFPSPVLRRTIRFIALAQAPAFFGVLAAGVYGVMGLFAYLYLMAGVLLVSLLARRLSREALLSERRAAEMAELEALGRAIIQVPPDRLELGSLLDRYVPRMFDYSRAEIRLFPDNVLLALPADADPIAPGAWRWLREELRPATFDSDTPAPWSEAIPGAHFRLVPIFDTNRQQLIGGICLRLQYARITADLSGSLASLQVLAAQIASAIQLAEAYRQRLHFERVAHELAFAREIQASFLPAELPAPDGWEISALLEPARQTSGDFYDLIELPDQRLGLLVADVADKGVGAALFMALTRTLLRTYALTAPDDPARVLAAANERILADTRNEMFVTVFYGVLNLQTGRLDYANAGHNPPFVVGGEDNQRLPVGGPPLGIFPHLSWQAQATTVAPGDLLLLYSDGLTEAHDRQLNLFGEERMLAVACSSRQQPALATQRALLEAVAAFTGDAPAFDDLTLVLAKRSATGPGSTV